MKKKDRFDRTDRLIDIMFFIALLAMVSAVTLTLFHRQTLGSTDYYHSDMKAYILEMQGLDSGYSFPYPVLFKLGAAINIFFAPEFSMALATMLLNSLAIVITKVFFNKLALKPLREAFVSHGWLAGVVISIISVSLFFISMLFPVGDIFYLPGIKYHYLGVFTSNPFHNATYMAARPFALLAFFWYARLLDRYEEGYNGRFRSASDEGIQSKAEGGVSLSEYILFSASLLIATMTKPSFTIVLVGAAGLLMLYRLFRSGFKNFIPTVQLGLCFIPTFIDLLYQFKGVFVPEEGAEGGIGFCFGEVWGYYCDNIPLAICLGIGFPLLVFILNHKEIKKNSIYRFSWQIYWMSFAMAFFLYEKGFRKPDFNFSWGYMYGIFFSFVGALLVLMLKTVECFKNTISTGRTDAAESTDKTKGIKKEQSRLTSRLLVVVQWLAYLAHLLCGLYYFSIIFRGGMYY